MKRWIFALASLTTVLALIVVFPTVVSGQELKPSKRIDIPGPKYIAGEVMVRFRPGTARSARDFAHGQVKATVIKHFKSTPALDLVRLPKGMSVEEGTARYSRNPNVFYALPNYVSRPSAIPDDTNFTDQWNLNNTGTDADIDAPEAWDLTTGSKDVVVAVIDSGIDYNHQDLMDNMFRNEKDCNGNGADSDGDGYRDDCYGIDTYNNDSDPMDDNGHGTGVAGVIGAKGNNGLGVAGVNWNVSLLACKSANEKGETASSDFVECMRYIEYLKEHGVNIVAVNYSAGGYNPDQAKAAEIDKLRQLGVIFVAAAGNEFFDCDFLLPAYPASFFLPNIISVTGTDNADNQVFNVGRHTIHLGAPGVGIWTTTPTADSTNPYDALDGTSFAAPQVAGVAALLKAYNSGWNWKQIKNRILAGGDSVASLSPATITGKRLNAHGALTCSNSTVYSRLRPIGSMVGTAVGDPVTLAALNINCASPAGRVQVSASPGGGTITLSDDGVAPDQEAGDGIYTGQFVPAAVGTYTLTFPGNDAVSVVALRNYQYSKLANPQYVDVSFASPLSFGDETLGGFSASVLPFPIHFGGQTFSEIIVSSDGVLSLGRPDWASPLFYNISIPSPDNGPVFVAPFWDDLEPEPGTSRNIYAAVVGTAPNRELVFEWRDVRFYNGETYGLRVGCQSDGGVTFEVVFYENSDDVLFNYKDVYFGDGCTFADRGGSGTVGIQVGRNTGSQYPYYLADDMSILWTIGALGVSPSYLAFGGVGVGTTSAPKTVTLSNQSGGTITISSIAPSSGFATQNDQCTGSLAPNSSCTVEVAFTPTSAGARNGDLTISSTSPDGDLKVILTGSGIVPVPTLSPSSLDFGQQFINVTSSPQPVTLKNEGDATLSSIAISTSGDFAQTNDCGTSLNAGQSCTINVTFTPTALGTRNGQLSVTTNAESEPDPVSLTGTGRYGGVVLLAPTTVDFGDQRVGTTSNAKSVQLTNNGTGSLNISGITASDPFAQNNDCGSSLAASSTCSIQITFKPTAAGPVANQLKIETNADSSPDLVDLSGTGVAPQVSLSPSSVDFGSQKVGVESSAKSVTLSNTGKATLNISSIEANAPFTLQSNGCGSTLAADASCSVQITFKPTSTGTANGQLTVDSDADSSPDHVALTGEGAVPVVLLSPTNLDFGQIEVNSTSSPKPVTLKNDGGAALSITNISMTGDFTKTDNCGTSLDTKQSCTINVTFKPTATGARTGHLTVTSDAASKTDTVSLSGEGIVGTLSLSQATMDMGDQLVGVESSPKNVTLTNTGIATVNNVKVDASAPFLQTNNCPTSLVASSSCTIQVTFKPTTTGIATGEITVTSDAQGSPHSLALRGNGVAPVVSLSPTSIDFGGQQVGKTSSPRNAKLTNTGTGTLNISSIAASAPFAQSNNCGSSLAANASCNIDVTFTPTTADTVTGQVTIKDNASGSPHTISLSGKGNEGGLRFEVSILDFGKQLKGTGSQQQLVKLTNIGSAPVTVSNVKLQSGGTDFYLAGQSCENRSPIAAGYDCSVGIEFKPTTTGPLTDTLQVYSDAPDSPNTLTLRGEGTDFSMGMAQGSSNSASVNAGQAATYNLSIAPVEGFEGSTTLTCKWNTPQPRGTACSVTPATVNVNGNGPANATVRITTTARSMAPVGWEPQPPPPTSYPVSHLVMWLLGLAALATLALRRRRATAVLASVLFIAVLWTACGGGGSGGGTTPIGTPAGTSTLTVTGTTSGMSHSTNLTLIVK